jgi:hypothetical protein
VVAAEALWLGVRLAARPRRVRPSPFSWMRFPLFAPISWGIPLFGGPHAASDRVESRSASPPDSSQG